MGHIDIRKLTLDELVGVVNLYPWFGGARKELCKRMRGMGADWDAAQYADAAMYVCAREKIAAIMRSGKEGDWSDVDVEKLIKSYLSESHEVEEKVRPGKYMLESEIIFLRKTTTMSAVLRTMCFQDMPLRLAGRSRSWSLKVSRI